MMMNGPTSFKKKFASSHSHRHRRTTMATTPTSSALRVVPPRPSDSNWEVDTKSSCTNVDVKDFVPPWRDYQSSAPRSGSRAIPKKDALLPSYARSAPPDDDDADAGGGCVNGLGDGGSSVGTTTLLLRNIRWPLIRDPPGSSGANYPLQCARIAVTILSTVSTWHLHAINGHSPVLASSAMARSSAGAGGHVRHLRRHVGWAPRAEPIDRRVARGADVAVVQGAGTRGGRVPGDWGQARSIGRGVVVSAGAMRLLNCP